MKNSKLPDGLVVECQSAAQTTFVLNYIGSTWGGFSHWEYVEKYPVSYNQSNIWHRKEDIKYKDSPIYTYEQWEKLKNGEGIEETNPLGLIKGRIYTFNSYGSEENKNEATFDKYDISCDVFIFTNWKLNNETFLGGGAWGRNSISNIKEKTKQMEKKIIGYKAPYDLFGGNIKAGELFSKVTENSYKTTSTGSTQYSRHLPKEIVEQWEPVYNQEYEIGEYVTDDDGRNIYKIGSYKNNNYYPAPGKYSSGKDINISYSFGYKLRRATKEEIEAAQSVKISGYTAEAVDGEIAFGCQRLTKQDLHTVEKLLNNEINASITIHNTKITKEIIQKLLNKLQ